MRSYEPRDFSKRGDTLPIPNLIDVQIESYQRFLQKNADQKHRKNEGLEALLREVFPIESYDGNLRLEYNSYDLSEARYTPDECRALRLTYGMPFRIQVKFVRKDKDEVVEDSIYVGEIPIMIGGGEFIINGAERVIVNQLHRSPGVDFLVEVQEGIGRCTDAASSRSAGAGSNVRLRRKTRWRCASTRAAKSRRRHFCGRWMKNTARPNRSSRNFIRLKR